MWIHVAALWLRAGLSHCFAERGSKLGFLLPRERSHHDFRWRGRNGRRKFEIQDGMESQQ
jgi:hypothetical protein